MSSVRVSTLCTPGWISKDKKYVCRFRYKEKGKGEMNKDKNKHLAS